jgi:uncharacterized membrane protein
MSTSATGASSTLRQPELDVLRGLAVVFMVVNHVGVRLLSQADATQGGLGALVFVGSFAPVLFFFATGVGAGLAGERRGIPAFWPMADKVLLLFLADAFMSLQSSAQRWWFDFFAFIGLCVLSVWLVQRTRRPVVGALVAIMILLVLRYALGPWAHAQGWTRADTLAAKVLAWCLGTPGVYGFSYLATPWLVYPLAGFVLGAWYGAAPASLRPRALWPALSVAALALGAAGVAYWKGASFFRWGAVAIAFFVLSIAVVALACLLACLLVRRLPSAGRMLSMPGVAAFAAVPVHYALLAWAKPVLGALTPLGFVAVAIGLLGLTLLIARGVEAAVQRLRGAGDRPYVATALLVLTLVAGAVTVTRAPQHHALVGGVAQLLVVALFAWRYRLSRAVRLAP